MTLLELKTRVRERLDESDVGSLRYADGVTQSYLIDGIRTYVTKTGCQMGRFRITQEVNTLLYDLPCDFIQATRVLWDSNGTYIPLSFTTSSEMDNAVYQWQRSTDTRARSYLLLGLDRIALWPMSTVGGEVYYVDYKRDVYTGLSSIPEQDHGVLVNYAIGRHLLAERKPEDGMMEMAEFDKAVAAAKRRFVNVDREWALSARGF